jgi:glycosyltransferase 2 family protein
MTLRKYFWPVVGGATIVVCAWLLYKELRGLSLEDVGDSLGAISSSNWLLAGLSTVFAYAALAGYDRIALMHLGREVSLWFILVCSFTTYALSHNIGASVLSGGVVRYRAYSSKGLSAREIGALIAICSFTFVLGTLLLAGVVLVLKPDITERFSDILPISASFVTGYAILAVIGLYVVASFLRLRALRIGSVELAYPSPRVVLSQLVIGPLELVGAAGIIYFALPEAGTPGFIVVLGIFLVSFSAALVSHAPGGIGVLELVFVMGMPDVDRADVIAALLVFRLFYLIIPFMVALLVIFVFERTQFRARMPER